MNSDLCAICDKPFPATTTRFLHFIGHVQRGEAVGHFNEKRNWFFTKTEMTDSQREVNAHLKEIFDRGESAVEENKSV